MPNQKPDRRIQRTRQQLRQALLSLMLERGYDSLSVQDITDRANLGRATFYLHYQDKDDLLIECMESLVDEFTTQLQGQPPQDWS
jgi:AcrR family transcriptional regulator